MGKDGQGAKKETYEAKIRAFTNISLYPSSLYLQSSKRRSQNSGPTSLCVGNSQIHRGDGTVLGIAVVFDATCLTRPRLLHDGDWKSKRGPSPHSQSPRKWGLSKLRDKHLKKTTVTCSGDPRWTACCLLGDTPTAGEWNPLREASDILQGHTGLSSADKYTAAK